VVANGNIVKKVRLPVQLLPASTVLSGLINFALSLVVLGSVLALLGPRHPEGVIWLPILAFIQTVMGLGFAYLLAALNVFFRDVHHIVGVLLTAWYFLTPILFPISLVSDPAHRSLLYLNPMTPIIVGYQRALLDGLPPEWPALAWSAVFAACMFLIGFAYFQRSKDSFEEVL
jgi:lipopolysaccharide transport system permease protein